MNSGYVGYSRSVRSQRAIEDFEMPLSLIKKAVIMDFLEEYEEDFSESDLKLLNKLSVAKCTYVAKDHTARASWHHTSIYFNETDHYDLLDVANKALEIKNEIDQLYAASIKRDVDVQFGVMEVQIWGGSRRRPKLEGHEVVAGI